MFGAHMDILLRKDLMIYCWWWKWNLSCTYCWLLSPPWKYYGLGQDIMKNHTRFLVSRNRVGKLIRFQALLQPARVPGLVFDIKRVIADQSPKKPHLGRVPWYIFNISEQITTVNLVSRQFQLRSDHFYLTLALFIVQLCRANHLIRFTEAFPFSNL